MKKYPEYSEIGSCEVYIPERAVKDFNTYSGTNVDDALKFLEKVVEETDKSLDKSSDSYDATLFYSGYAGWALLDDTGRTFGVIAYDSNRYGLEDAHQGSGWEYRSFSKYGIDPNLESRIRAAVVKNSRMYKPDKVRM